MIYNFIIEMIYIFLVIWSCIYIFWSLIPFWPKLMDFIRPLEESRPDFLIIDIELFYGKKYVFLRKYLFIEIGISTAILHLNAILIAPPVVFYLDLCCHFHIFK